MDAPPRDLVPRGQDKDFADLVCDGGAHGQRLAEPPPGAVVVTFKDHNDAGLAKPKAVKLRFASDPDDRPPIDWLVNRIIPSRGILLIVGATSVGKTWVGLELARAIACGDDFLGEQVRKIGGTLMFAFEGREYVKPRWDAMWKIKSLPYYERNGLVLPVKPPLIVNNDDDLPKLITKNIRAGLDVLVQTVVDAKAMFKKRSAPNCGW